ncbi:MAG: hypothetical protein Q9217_002847 [Psora testacea]
MRLTDYLLTALATTSAVSGLIVRPERYNTVNSLQQREAEAGAEVLKAPLIERFDEELLSYLEKRRGGGGTGGGGGRSSGSSGSSSGSSGSSGSGSSGSSGSSGGGSSGAGSGSRNTGTASSKSSSSPSYGGGRYYGGGATTPYRSGSRTPIGGLLPFALVGGAVGAATIFPGYWLYGAYAYNYHNPYSFRNRTNTTSNANDTLPVTCLCEMYSACGCDDNGDSTFLDGLVGNGSYAALNKSVVNVSNVNGSRTLVLNGTLPNGTDDSTEDSSTDSSSDSRPDTSAATRQSVIQVSGFWAVGGIVGAMVWLL